MATANKFIPGSDATSEEIFTYPFFINEESKEFIKNHGKIMFIIRGPPGTGKWSLTELMIKNFPTGVKCSADDYFTNTFNKPVRTKESLKQSHFYCHKKVKHECTKNSHPVIVSNTHMKKSEMQEYLNLAEKYEYTVIISSTLDKFEVSPEILAKSNTKGLDKKYFEKRLAAWQDVFPILMGWFLCAEDSVYILHQLQCALEALLADGKFCRVFNAFDTDALLSNYKAKTLLCCIAGILENNVLDFQNFYKSAEIRDSYGKSFIICIQGFLVTKSDIFAIVQLDDILKNLTFKHNFVNKPHTEEEDDTDSMIKKLQCMSMKDSYNFKVISLGNEFSKNPKTAVLKERSDDHLNIKNSSFIHLAQTGKKVFSIYELNELFRGCVMSAVEELAADQFNAVEGGYAVHRLHNDGWLIRIPKILSVKTVFTGLYI